MQCLQMVLMSDDRLGIVGAAKPLRSNGAERRNPGKPGMPSGRQPPENYGYGKHPLKYVKHGSI